VLEQTPFGQEIRLSVNKEAAATLTRNEAALLRKRFEHAVNGGVAALLCDMGLAEDGLGEYYLGRQAFQKKRFKAARTHLERAMELNKDSQDIANDLAVTYAHQKQYDKAIELARQILDRTPDYGPAAFNLAWWHAFVKHDPAEAKRCYTRARELQIPANNKLERALKKVPAQ
jgi:tetratricopeptide (TPR) repeat protein